MNRKEALEKHVQHSWAVLEHKWRYYVGKAHGVEPIADEKYDKIELNYIKLCNALKLKTTASDMVGFDFKKPSCILVHYRMCAKYKLDPTKTKKVF